MNKYVTLFIIFIVWSVFLATLVFTWSTEAEANIHKTDHNAYQIQSRCGFYPTYAGWVAEDKLNGFTSTQLIEYISKAPLNDYHKNMRLLIVEYVYENNITQPGKLVVLMYRACKERLE